ncbi:cytochrome P450 [Xylariaceae sp. FL0255]|nr:cytochrome P450 [Xylariaceae sp. FL0255]
MELTYIAAALVAAVGYVAYCAIWRLYFSPIAHFPGPKLAALTSLYDMYYNIWLGGKYIWRIRDMHEKYGPIIRVSPWDLHVSDPEFHEVLYPSTSSGRRADKEETLTKFFGLDDSLFSTMPHDLHKMRRTALLPYFSTAYVRRLQPVLQERLDVLLSRMKEYHDTDEPINANCMFAAYSNDITQMTSFGYCQQKIESPGFDPSDRDASLDGAQSFHILKRVPWMNEVLMPLPDWFNFFLSPALGAYMKQKKEIRARMAKLCATSMDEWEGQDTIPIFRSMQESSKLPAHEKLPARMAQDAQMLQMAGTLTMAYDMEHLTYWLCTYPDVLRKLKEELHSVMPSIDVVGKVPLTTLEALPYMTAVIKESIRLIYGNSTPHLRSCPDQALTYEDKKAGKTWVIPPGTPVGMSSVLLHHIEENFPDSYRFLPDRWLGEEGKKLDKYMVGFGKGSRICLGMNLAWGEVRLGLSQIWRLYATPEVALGDEIGVLSLHNTTPYDVTLAGDFFIGKYNKPTGVEFKLKSRK